MKTKEEYITKMETRGVNDFMMLEVLLDIRELLDKIISSNKNKKYEKK